MTMKPMIYSTNKVRETLYKGTHDGYDFEIISFGYHPCAYVTLPKDHKYTDEDYDEIDIDVHGGLTYKILNTIGWDYGHCYDYSPLYEQCTDKKWTTEEIFEEVKDVIRQLKEKEV